MPPYTPFCNILQNDTDTLSRPVIIPKDKFRRHKPTSFPGCANDEDVLANIEKHQQEGQKIENYAFDLKRLEPFRYRFTDALRAVTRIAIREARIKELRIELVKSQKLSRYVRNFFYSTCSHANPSAVRRAPRIPVPSSSRSESQSSRKNSATSQACSRLPSPWWPQS